MGTLFLLVCFGLLILGVVRCIKPVNQSIRFDLRKFCFFVLGAWIFYLLYLSWNEVDSNSVGVVKRNGSAIEVLAPGGHFVIPLIETVTPVTTQTLAWKVQEDASSSDLQIVHTEVTLTYHFDPQYAIFILTKLIDNTSNAVENKTVIPTILEGIKSTTAKFTASELIDKRALVRDGIELFAKEKLAQYHIIAETTSITDFHFSTDYEDSIEKKVTAVQKAEQAENDLNRIKIEAQQKIAAAEGEAQALRLQREQITPELLQLRTVEMMREKWDGKLPETYYGGAAPLPVVEVFKKK